MKLRILASALAATGATALGACDDTPPTPTAADLAVVTQRLDQDLNDPAQQIHEGLKQANADRRIYPEELFVRAEGRLNPVDWWDYRQGLIHLGGVDSFSRGYFTLTPKGEAFLKAAPPQYFASRFQAPPQVSCSGTKSVGTCQVTGTATVDATAEGAPLAGGRTVPAQPFAAVVQYDPSGWSIQEFHTTGPMSPKDSARRALLGDDASVAKARDRYALEVNRLVK